MKNTTRFVSAAGAAFLLLAARSQGQSGGFAPGELVLYSPAVQGSSSDDGAIVRIDPLTGQTSLLLDLLQTQGIKGSAVYDPFRDRLIFCGGFTAPGQPTKAYTLDALGLAQDLGLGNRSLYAFAPASAGRVYYADSNSITTAPFKYIDANDVEHVLMDSTGTQPFVLGASNISTMIHDASTNALFIACNSGAPQACSGGIRPAKCIWSMTT